MPANYTIRIHVVPRSRGRWGIRVTPNHQRAHWREVIEWVCPEPFVVYFGPSGPMTSAIFDQGHPEGRVRYNANLMGARTFKYIVGVFYSNEIKVLDPDLEIVP